MCRHRYLHVWKIPLFFHVKKRYHISQREKTLLYTLGYMRIKFTRKSFYYNSACNKIGSENSWDAYPRKVITIFSLGLKMTVKVTYETKTTTSCILWASLSENHHKFEQHFRNVKSLNSYWPRIGRQSIAVHSVRHSALRLASEYIYSALVYTHAWREALWG